MVLRLRVLVRLNIGPPVTPNSNPERTVHADMMGDVQNSDWN